MTPVLPGTAQIKELLTWLPHFLNWSSICRMCCNKPDPCRLPSSIYRTTQYPRPDTTGHPEKTRVHSQSSHKGHIRNIRQVILMVRLISVHISVFTLTSLGSPTLFELHKQDRQQQTELCLSLYLRALVNLTLCSLPWYWLPINLCLSKSMWSSTNHLTRLG